jgi:hypothetical protein
MVLVAVATVAIGAAVPWLTGGAQPAQPISMELVDQTFTVGAGDTISMSFSIEGDLPAGVLPTTTTPSTTTTSTTAPPSTGRGPGTAPTTTTTAVPASTVPPAPAVDGQITVVAFPPLTSSSQVADALAGSVVGEPDDGVLIDDLSDHLTVTTRGGRRSLRLDLAVPVPADGISAERDLGLITPGVYPIRVAVRIDGTTVAEYTTLVRRLADLPPPGLRLAVVAGALDDTPARDLQAIVSLGAQGPPLSVMIPPDALRDVADRRPRLVRRLAAALSGDEAVSLATDAIDPSSAATADLDTVFTDALSAGEDTLIALLPETPPRRTSWPFLDDLSVDGADLLTQLGVRILVSDEAHAAGLIDPPSTPLPGQQVAVPIGERSLGALVVDDSVAGLVDRPPDGADPLLAALELFASLTVDEPRPGARGVLLTTTGLGVPDPAVIDALANFVDEAPDVEFVTLSELPGYSTIDTGTELELPAAAGVDLTRRVSMVDSARVELDDTASMLPDDDPRPAEWDATLDGLLTTELDDAEASETIDGMLVDAETIRDSIVPPDPFTFTLTGRESEVRLRVGNSSNEVLRVTVVPSSPKLTFPDGPQTVDVPPGDPTLVPIRVSARSNGTSSVAMSLRTPAGGELIEPVFLTAKVNALTGLSQVITGGALLVLATWWLSHLRQRRRQRRGLPTRRDARQLARAAAGENVSPDAAEALAVADESEPLDRTDTPQG